MESIPPVYSHATEGGNERQYAPPWADLSIIGIAGSSGSGKTSVAMEIVRSLNLPWVVILVMVIVFDPSPQSAKGGLDGEIRERYSKGI